MDLDWVEDVTSRVQESSWNDETTSRSAQTKSVRQGVFSYEMCVFALQILTLCKTLRHWKSISLLLVRLSFWAFPESWFLSVESHGFAVPWPALTGASSQGRFARCVQGRRLSSPAAPCRKLMPNPHSPRIQVTQTQPKRWPNGM